MFEESRVDDAAKAARTRWDAPRDRPPAREQREHGGIYLAIIAAVVVPLLIGAAIVLSTSDSDTELEAGETEQSDSGLDTISTASDVATASTSGVSATDETTIDTASIAVAPEETSPGEPEPELQTQIATPASIHANPPGSSTVGPATGPAAEEVTSSPTSTAGAGTAGSTPPSIDPPTTRRPTTTSVASPTTVVSTTSAPVTTVTSAPASHFQRRVEIGQLGDNFVRFRFTSASTTPYRVVVFGNGRVAATGNGTAIGGELVNESVNGLTPGTDYTVQVILSGPPAFTSPAVAFRTAGGNPVTIVDTVEVLDLRAVAVEESRFELNYESNVCANGSFVIRDRSGNVVGSNSGQETGCTTRHLAIPGFWTPRLQPGTTYTVTVTVEAGGAGRGDGNVASATIMVTTSG